MKRLTEALPHSSPQMAIGNLTYLHRTEKGIPSPKNEKEGSRTALKTSRDICQALNTGSS
jgi:hypothetical protein